MHLLEKLSLPSENVVRKKPCNQNYEKNLFKKELTKTLPIVSPKVSKKSYIPPCGKLFNGLSFNFFQFNRRIGFKELFKSYLKSLYYLIKTRKLTKFDKIFYLTNSNSHNFFHWFLDVLQKLEFMEQAHDQILDSGLKVIIPIGHDNNYYKESLKAFGFDFYYQAKNEIIISNESILLPNIAPTGNYRKNLVLNLGQRMRKYWISQKTINQNKKRIYITRKNSKRRRLENENKIIPILEKYGFIILDFDVLNFNEQLNYILDSEILISVHGAGLTHMLWMKQKSKIMEIRARNNCNDNCYFTLASDLGHNYFYVIADKTDRKKSNHISDLEINPEDFLLQIQKMIKFE